MARADDDGSPDPRLLAAVQSYDAEAGRLPDVLAALHVVRVLAPVVALAGDSAAGAGGLTVDRSADIALPVLVDADGSRAVLIFSGLSALIRWDATAATSGARNERRRSAETGTARPVPVTGPRAAEVAIAEGATTLVLDVAGPTPVTLEEPEVRALVTGRGTVAAYDDRALAHDLTRVLARFDEVLGAWIAPATGVDARVTVVVDPGCSLEAVAAQLTGPVREAGRLAGGVRGLDLALQPGRDPEPPGRRIS